MLKLFITMTLWALCQATIAGINFKFTPGSTSTISSTVKATMEKNISALLTEIDNAGKARRNLNFTGISIEEVAKRRLNALWETVHMTCNFTNNVKDCLHDVHGYQARDIYVTMLPQDEFYTQDRQRALTISLDRAGKITGARLALESHADVNAIMNGNGQVVDKRRREEILKFVEDFRCYYNEKDTSSIKMIFSPEALIVTATVLSRPKTRGTEVHMTSEAQVRYTVQDRDKYIRNLGRCFSRNEVIDVKFEHISVAMSGANPDIYGVKLKQTWNSSTYHDVGWLFLLWDFHDPDHPQIHVRTWQPYNLPDGRTVSEDEVFSLGDFIIN